MAVWLTYKVSLPPSTSLAEMDLVENPAGRSSWQRLTQAFRAERKEMSKVAIHCYRAPFLQPSCSHNGKHAPDKMDGVRFTTDQRYLLPTTSFVTFFLNSKRYISLAL